MQEERRQDIGAKVKDGIILILLSLFITIAWGTANAGYNKAAVLEVKEAKMEECIVAIKEDLREIKDLLKRTSPFERNNVGKVQTSGINKDIGI